MTELLQTGLVNDGRVEINFVVRGPTTPEEYLKGPQAVVQVAIDGKMRDLMVLDYQEWKTFAEVVGFVDDAMWMRGETDYGRLA